MVDRQRPRETLHRGLARGIGEAVRRGLAGAQHRRHVEDDAPARGDHSRQHGLDHHELAAGIQLEAAVPVLDAALEDRSLVHPARAVEKDVHRTDGTDVLRDRVVVGDVEAHRRDGLVAGVLLEELRIDVGRVHRRALAHEGEHGGAPHALAGGRDEGFLAFKSICHGLCHAPLSGNLLSARTDAPMIVLR